MVVNLTTDAIRKYILGNFHHASSSSSPKFTVLENGTRIGHFAEFDATFCRCLTQLESSFCVDNESHHGLSKKIVDARLISSGSSMDFHSDLGRMLYTIAILLMFSFVIFALMVRSISRSHSSAELETLLETMRFREELDIQLRQKHRLRKAKRKVTAWLCRGNGAKLWQSSPHILLPTSGTIRNNSLQSTGSYIPEIVISTDQNNANCAGGIYARSVERQNSCTPSLSLIYDFSYDSRKGSQEHKNERPSAEGDLLMDGSQSEVMSSGGDSNSREREEEEGLELMKRGEQRGRKGTN